MAATLFPDLVINDETIPYSVVAAEAQNHSAPRGKPGLAWRAAANAIAVRTLLLQDARRRSLTPDPQQVAPGKFETDEEALIRQVLEEAVQVTPPEEDELKAEWEKNPDRFRSPPLWEVSHILCGCDPRDEDARKTAEQRAITLTKLAIDTPRGFAALAAQESDCDSKKSGGTLGQLGPGDTVPEFEEAVRRLDEGEITADPVLSRHGYHIIRLDAVARGQVLPYSAVRQKISDAIERAAWVRASRDYVQQLVAAAEISGADLKAG